LRVAQLQTWEIDTARGAPQAVVADRHRDVVFAEHRVIRERDPRRVADREAFHVGAQMAFEAGCVAGDLDDRARLAGSLGKHSAAGGRE